MQFEFYMGHFLIIVFQPIKRLIVHTNSLMSADENLCIEVLSALQQMLEKETDFGDKVFIVTI